MYAFGSGSLYNLTYPGFEKVYLRNNIALGGTSHDFWQADNSWTDSDYNFIGNPNDYNKQQNAGMDLHSISRKPGLVNMDIVVDTTFPEGWTITQKLA